jgi:hypothetical protein
VATHDTLVSERVDRTVAIRDGRVSSEVLRHTTVSEAGGDEVHATEYAVLDRAGRLQLPRSMVEALGLEQRVRVELLDDHVALWPDRPRYARPEGSVDEVAPRLPDGDQDPHARYRPR